MYVREVGFLVSQLGSCSMCVLFDVPSRDPSLKPILRRNANLRLSVRVLMIAYPGLRLEFLFTFARPTSAVPAQVSFSYMA